MKKSQSDWDKFYLNVAVAYSLGSKDPSTKVGALLVDSENRLRSAGYNNFCKDEDDHPKWYEDRDHKLKHIRHAEVACLKAFPHSMDNNFRLYTTLSPCIQCAIEIIDDGRIKQVITFDDAPDRWKVELEKATEKLINAGITVKQYERTR